jgi:hypothetical protein
MINNKRMITLLFCLLPVMLGISGTSTAAEDTVYNINEFTCKTIMRADDFDQDAAIAFMHGYLFGRSGQTNFDVERLRQATDAFIDSCLDTPKAAAINVLADKIK